MRYKRLIIILSSIVGAILLCFILSFALFGLKTVELNFKNETTIFADKEQQQAIINSGNFSYSMPIFSTNKQEIVERLELANSYLKVINIETVFPNKLIIHCAEREELFAIKAGDNLFYICDDELKVLRLDTNYESSQKYAIFLEGVVIQNKTARVGEYLSFHNSEPIIKNISNAFAYNNKTISDIRGMFSEIKLSYEMNYYTCTSEAVLTFVTFDGFIIKVDLPSKNLIEKFNLMIALIPASVEKYGTHQLVIAINPNNLKDTYIRYENLENK